MPGSTSSKLSKEGASVAGRMIVCRVPRHTRGTMGRPSGSFFSEDCTSQRPEPLLAMIVPLCHEPAGTAALL